MKILHCGDLHLDSPLSANLEGEKKKQRKSELVLSFVRIVEYAAEHGADAIIIAGDLFDGKHVTKRTQNVVKDTILRYASIDFLYLKGNHDEENFLSERDFCPGNLKLFHQEWTYYRYGDVVIAGAEFGASDNMRLYDSLLLEKNDCNIVVLHGQTEKYSSGDRSETVQIGALKNKNIDYLALGHIHSYRYEALDSRGAYCYPGCPEGRGFDECGEKGFVWLDTEGGKISHSFIPYSLRRVHEVTVDISDAQTTIEAERAVRACLSDIPEKDMVKVVLAGKVSLSAERDMAYLYRRFSEDFFFFKINDSLVRIAIRPEDYENDISLRGEFIRLVTEGDYSDEEQRMILEIGVRVLAGEEAESCF